MNHTGENGNCSGAGYHRDHVYVRHTLFPNALGFNPYSLPVKPHGTHGSVSPGKFDLPGIVPGELPEGGCDGLRRLRSGPGAVMGIDPEKDGVLAIIVSGWDRSVSDP